MAVDITIPRLGWSMDEGAFVQWLKRDGEYVHEGDVLFELESDKSTQAVESFDSGVLRIPADGPQPGDIVKVGQRLGYLCKKGERAPFENARAEETPAHPGSEGQHETTIENGSSSPTIARPQVADDAQATPSPLEGAPIRHVTDFFAERLDGSQNGPASSPKAHFGSIRDQMKVSPRAARAAAKFGIALSEITGRGASGRVRECDVLAAVARHQATPPSTAADRAEAVGRVPHETIDPPGKSATSSVRQTIATRMLAAAQQTAAVTLTASADATQLVNLRQQYRTCTTNCAAKTPSYTAVLVKIAGEALQRHLNMLGQWTGESIVVPDGVHVAVAVDTPIGLMTPVLRDVPALSLAQVSERLSGLISRARARRLVPDELQGGTFTVTNLGAYRVDAFTPLLNLPQTSILGVGRIGPQPIARGRSVEVRDLVTLSLTFDHRAVDGAAAAALLTTICELVEKPLPMLLS
jgi:pyruvate dehydrogenase E2 component (dihydrolipoamide acetyltransferase)